MSIRQITPKSFISYIQLILAILTIAFTVIIIERNLDFRNREKDKMVMGYIIDKTKTSEIYSQRLDSIQNSIINNGIFVRIDTSSLDRLDGIKLMIRLNTIENKLENISITTDGLKQAINPLRPDEVLTIVRLKDEINEINNNLIKIEENMELRQQAFEESIRHETSNANQSTTLILVVIIPLILNFLYTVWKDFKTANSNKKEDK